MANVDVRIEDKELMDYFRRVHVRCSDMTPANREISEVLRDGIEQAFADQRDPETGQPWPALSAFTIAARQLAGYWPGKILQQSGRLVSSFETDAGPDFAAAGTNVIYAALHNFGGTVRPKNKKALAFGGRLVSKVVIPQRRFAAVSDATMGDILEVLGRWAVDEPG